MLFKKNSMTIRFHYELLSLAYSISDIFILQRSATSFHAQIH